MANDKQVRKIIDKLISDYLVDILTTYVKKRTKIPEEYMNALIFRSMDVVRKEDCNEISPKFSELSDLVSLYTRGHQFEYLSVCENTETKDLYNINEDRAFVFQMGELNTCISMLNDVIHKRNIKEAEENNRELFDKNLLIFLSIYDEPGITHRDLANKSGKSASGLTNFINKVRPFGYIIQSSLGRNKHYYLTEKGNILLKNKKKALDISEICKSIQPSIDWLLKSSFYGSDDMFLLQELCDIKQIDSVNGIENKSFSFWRKNRLSLSKETGDEDLILEYTSKEELRITTRKKVTNNEVISYLLGYDISSFDQRKIFQ